MKKFPVEYAKILVNLIKDAPKEEYETIFKTYISYLSKERALSHSDTIITEFVRLLHEERGTSPLHVTVAHEMSEQMKQEIEKKFQGDIDTITINKDIIGGIIVRKGNTILNTSIQSQLDSLANSMK